MNAGELISYISTAYSLFLSVCMILPRYQYFSGGALFFQND